MAYTHFNYRTKKALKQALAEGQRIGCYNPGLGLDLTNYTGTVYLEGPHYPEPHKWYAAAELHNGIIVKVR